MNECKTSSQLKAWISVSRAQVSRCWKVIRCSVSRFAMGMTFLPLAFAVRITSTFLTPQGVRARLPGSVTNPDLGGMKGEPR